MSQQKKRVTIELPHSAKISMPNPPSTPSTNRQVNKNKENMVKSGTKLVLLVSTPSSRHATLSSTFSGRKTVSPTSSKVVVSPIRSIKLTSPAKSSMIPQPSDPKSMLRVKAQRDANLAVANSAKKDKENRAVRSPMKSELGKPQRLFSYPTTRTHEGLLCMSGTLPSRQRSPDKRSIVSSQGASANKQEIVLGLKSPAKRLGRSLSSKSLRQSQNRALISASTTSATGSPATDRKLISPVMSLSSIERSPPRMPLLSRSRSITKENMKDMKVLGERTILMSDEGDADDPTTDESEEDESMLATPSKRGGDNEMHLYNEIEDDDTVVLEEALEQLDIDRGPSFSSTPKAAAASRDSNDRPTPTDNVAAQKTAKSEKDVKLPVEGSTSKVPIKAPHIPTPSCKQHFVKAGLTARAVSDGTLSALDPTQPRARIPVRHHHPESQSSLAAKESPAKRCMRPLSDVVAFLDIRTSEGNDASAAFGPLLHKLGAKIVKQPSRNITHIIFKQGTPRTLHIARDMNVPCLTISWIVECGKQNSMVDEAAYAIELNSLQPPYPSHPKKKSLEPKILTQGLDGGNERTCVENRSPNAGKEVAISTGADELHLGVAAVGMLRLAHINTTEIHVERRKSLSHAPTVSSPLARRSWSVQDFNSDSEKE
ncbi:uncharacterized protein V1513DRAFT_452475 [Lipomyces chichibuensis]|uniref:uncharacterized protein n=1 Tax=Lipomyces chichibuensis TaxID=1546026 RepID=UPI0033441C3D